LINIIQDNFFKNIFIINLKNLTLKYMEFINILFIIFLIIIIYYYFQLYKYPIKKELKPIHNLKGQYNIFMYWETLSGKTKPTYLDLCYDTVLKNCSQDFKIHMLDEKSITQYLPELRPDLDKKLKIQQKVDYYRLLLLYKYGGIWLDADTIIIKSLIPLFEKLKSYNYVGFGCHHGFCSRTGKPNPANWVMMSKKNEILLKKCIIQADIYLDQYKSLKNNYFILGRNLISSKIKYLLNNNKNWDYYHHSSICTERDSNDRKLVNSRMISNEKIDNRCIDKIFFIPIYNTAPGFPQWFLKLNKEKLFKSNMLISKFFREALK